MTKTLLRTLFVLSIFFPLLVLSQNSDYDAAVRKYIDTYQSIAVKEMMTYHVPASITLAQGIFESNAGRSRLATEANNHFGIKCHKEWTGDKFFQDDETKNECFRKYSCAEESFSDHSAFLSQRDRYKGLFSLDITDYKGWAKGLKAAGYATNPAYADKLINTIEKYGLNRFDIAGYSAIYSDSLGMVRDTSLTEIKRIDYEVFAIGPGGRKVYVNNGLQFILPGSTDDLHKVATAFGVTEKKLLKWNDMKKNARLVPGQMLYLEPKKKRGEKDTYQVRPGDTMYLISQHSGIKLKNLYKLNHMKPGEIPHPGERLLLR